MCQYIFPDIDDCVNMTCGHGTCQDLVNGAQCQCDSGYDGDQCDISTYTQVPITFKWITLIIELNIKINSIWLKDIRYWHCMTH